MDKRILKAILCSCESVTKDLEKSKDFQKLLQDDQFLPTSNGIFNAACVSLTKLLSYKVSKEAYQRYTVRLHVISALRDWCRINEALQNFKIFTDQKKTLTFLNSLVEKYITDDILDTCDSSDDLLPLTSALMCLASTNSYYNYYIEKLLLKLVELESCDQSDYLLCYAVQKDANFNLNFSTIESIYNSQRCKLIEQPLVEEFMLCTDLNKDVNIDNSESINLLSQLYEFASKSTCIFLLVCAFLKELFIQLDYASTVMNFIQKVLKHIKDCCENQDNDILDLYPRNLQSIIILLQIQPEYHTTDSKSSTLRTLESIYFEDKHSVITLLLHFPQWLKLFGELFLNSNNI
ncbi:uncharacterized protein LOC117607870 [Osmia lignaria lignaria]|uniref:uncharacterized protein LOC117607870 n=1 Tax=Osmia lignaria lignaria TaxID=1437193 RepID=UPI00402B1C9A